MSSPRRTTLELFGYFRVFEKKIGSNETELELDELNMMHSCDEDDEFCSVDCYRAS